MIEVKTKVENSFTLRSKDVAFTFLPTGDILQAKGQDFMLNQVLGNSVDGSMNNLYLRDHAKDGTITHTPLLGVHSNSTFSVGEKTVKWDGQVEDLNYTVHFALGKENTWFWNVDVEGHNKTVDIVYGFDLGLSHQGALQSNESYIAHYVGHSVFEGENGYVVASRQNQLENIFPYTQQGTLTKNTGYSTDGFQFFGKSYKETNEPEILSKETLANSVYQYEFNYTALQSEKVELDGKESFVFYGLFQENHPEAITELEYQDVIQKDWDELKWDEVYTKQEPIKLHESIGRPLEVQSMKEEELNELYPNRLQEEKDGDTLLSFFTDDYNHIALKEKEGQLERQHGQILLTGQELSVDNPILATTSWMVGVFNAQVVLGNTSMNKLFTNTRNHLNVLKTQGQRIYVKINDTFRLLTMPSLFEIGFNHTKWIYKTKDETFIVTNLSSSQSSDVKLTIETASGKAYAYKVTNQIALHEKEYDVPFLYEEENGVIKLKASEQSIIHHNYKDLTYYLKVDAPAFTLSDGSSLLNRDSGHSSSLLVLDIPETETFSLYLQGSLDGEDYKEVDLDFETETKAYRSFFKETMNHFELEHAGEEVQSEVEKMNVTAWWYTHNMFVHYLSPHGLEQYGGAAWGTRDVAQGPAEYFMAMKQYTIVKKIILKLFTHQFIEDGNWPQWFMYDNYANIHAAESHGDIIVWPLKLLGDYLKTTHDFSILDEEIPYLSLETHQLTETEESLKKHVQKELDYITSHFLEGTYLSSYGDGDWDDTLQPHDQKLKKHMASTWTVALTYQTFKQFTEVMETYDTDLHTKLKGLTENIKKDYEKIIMATDTIPGFIYMENGETDFMVHPTDTKTGVTYRLLPMIRSMISELFDADQVDHHLDIIKENLTFADGIRLMNRPAHYAGGVSTNFKRAEQAANFGREIGLLYIHAHIRYIEAMAKIGKTEETWKSLLKINPINIKDHVPNAQRRQSNAYFSSSDANFVDRYDAQDNYNDLREGKVEVKGGWRIYSSGPGIYLNQMIANVLGLREEGNTVIFDPVMPEKLNGLTVKTKLLDKPVSVMYENTHDIKSIALNGKELTVDNLTNKYRKSGLALEKAVLSDLLDASENKLVIK